MFPVPLLVVRHLHRSRPGEVVPVPVTLGLPPTDVPSSGPVRSKQSTTGRRGPGRVSSESLRGSTKGKGVVTVGRGRRGSGRGFPHSGCSPHCHSPPSPSDPRGQRLDTLEEGSPPPDPGTRSTRVSTPVTHEHLTHSLVPAPLFPYLFLFLL